MGNDSSSSPFTVYRRRLLVPLAVIAAFAIGYCVSGPHDSGDKARVPPSTATSADASTKSEVEDKKPEVWTCAMHPQIRLPKPGKCPICFMDLIPLETHEHEDDEDAGRQYSMSAAAKKLAEVETAEARRQQAKVVVRMVGLVNADETRIAALTSRVDGRLDEIYINFTGVRVNKGDPMVKIWSPTLIKSQVELFETIRGSSPEESVIRGAEEKLIQYGLTRQQVEEIKEKKKPILEVTLRAPINGVVTRKMAILGQFVKEGQEMYFIDDLSHVWVKMDAYETDLPWIRYGQKVTFTTPAAPGRTFTGRVQFIDPMLDMKTRSVKVRVEAANPDYTLKPGMFVTAQVEAEVDAKGRVIKSEWIGKYICPVHPTDEVSSQPGTCPDSKMALQPVSFFGYADDPNPQLPLVIPASSALVTGKRAIVYVEVPADRPTYEGREIVLGPRAGDMYVVHGGLNEGERVVTKGNFKIDSAMQIMAKPSMMSPRDPRTAGEGSDKPEEEVISKLKAGEAFLGQLTPVIEAYLELKESLVVEKTEDVVKNADKLGEAIKSVRKDGLEKNALRFWKKQSKIALNRLKIIEATKEIEKQRKAFDPLSESMARIVMAFRHVMKEPVYLFHCPEALDKQGAYWLDAKKEPRNPYFGETKFKGQSYLTCGEVEETIPPETGESGTGPAADPKPQPPEASASNPPDKPGPTDSGPGPHSEHGGKK